MRIFIGLLFCLLMTNCRSCQIKEESQKPMEQWQEIISHAQKQLAQTGVLVQQADGYAYLKVDDRFIHDLFPRLKADGFEKPPYFRRNDAPGAHISVIYEDEQVSIKESGKQFSFTLDKMSMVTTKKATYIILQVHAPELEQLRQRYGLSPLLKNNQFHITIAKKKSPR